MTFKVQISEAFGFIDCDEQPEDKWIAFEACSISSLHINNFEEDDQI